MIYDLVPETDPILHRPAPMFDLDMIQQNEFGLVTVVDSMLETMHKLGGIGLSANQVNLWYRLFVMQTRNMAKPMVCWNPSVLWESSKTDVDSEGCLSFPGVRLPIERSIRIRVQYWDRSFKKRIHYMNGLAARAFIHELNHLDGFTMFRPHSYRTEELA